MKNKFLQFYKLFFLSILFLSFGCSSNNDANPNDTNEELPKLYSFKFNEFYTKGIIDNTLNKVDIFGPFTDENIKALTPIMIIPENTSVIPPSGVSNDFSSIEQIEVRSENISRTYQLNMTAKSNSGLIILDAQNANFPAYNDKEVLDNINTLREKAKDADQPVIYIQHTGSGLWRINSASWQIHEAIQPASGDYVVQKSAINAFGSKDFIDLIDSLEIYRLIFVGTRTELCIWETMVTGSLRGYHIVLISDAHTTNVDNAEEIIETHHSRFISEKYGELISTDNFIY